MTPVGQEGLKTGTLLCTDLRPTNKHEGEAQGIGTYARQVCTTAHLCVAGGALCSGMQPAWVGNLRPCYSVH